MTGIQIWTGGLLSLAAMSASAQTCDNSQLAVNATNLQIIAKGSVSKGQYASAHVVSKGENIDYTGDVLVRFDPCNRLQSATTSLSRDDGVTRMHMDYSVKRDTDGWLTNEAAKLTLKDKTLTDMKGEMRYMPESDGRITEAVMTFTINDQPAQTRTHYEYDEQKRLIRSVSLSTLQSFEETKEYSYDSRGFLSRIASGKEITRLSWADDGRLVKSEKETNHPYSVLYTVDECTKWDAQGSCLVQKREETEKYAKQTTHYTYVITSEYQYY